MLRALGWKKGSSQNPTDFANSYLGLPKFLKVERNSHWNGAAKIRVEIFLESVIFPQFPIKRNHMNPKSRCLRWIHTWGRKGGWEGGMKIEGLENQLGKEMSQWEEISEESQPLRSSVNNLEGVWMPNKSEEATGNPSSEFFDFGVLFLSAMVWTWKVRTPQTHELKAKFTGGVTI